MSTSSSAKRILTIPQTTPTFSNAIVGKMLGNAKAITVYAPATLTGTVTVQVAADEVSPTYVDLYNGATAATCPVSRGTRWELAGHRALRLNSSAGEAAARTFEVTLHFE